MQRARASTGIIHDLVFPKYSRHHAGKVEISFAMLGVGWCYQIVRYAYMYYYPYPQKSCNSHSVYGILTLMMLEIEYYSFVDQYHACWCPGGRFKNTYELLNLRALKFSLVNKIHIFQCMGKIFCMEFQRYPLKFHTKYLTHTLKDMIFMQFWNFKSS